MFGEDYFRSRGCLADLAQRVLELAERTGADATPLLSGEGAEGLESPFLFLTCGEARAGKSMVLNGIFGGDVCEMASERSSVGKPPRLQWYKFAEKYQNKTITPLVEECYRPVEFLKNFNLIDTPGIDLKGVNASGEEVQGIIQRFLPSVDIALWVVPVSNPWGASFWKFFADQNEAVLKKSVIVLQQTDLKNEGELKVIQGHVKDLAKQRLGFVPPIFPVSAKRAVMAKRAEPVDVQQWKHSGFPELEQFIEDLVSKSPARLQILLGVRKALAEVLRSIEYAVEDRARLLKDNENFLKELEDEVEAERKRNSEQFAVKFAVMRDVFAGKNQDVKRYVRRKLGFKSTLKSLFLAENTAKVIEVRLIDMIEASVQAQADQDGVDVVEGCREHWETVRPRVKERLSITLGEFDALEGEIDTIRDAFKERMGFSARKALFDMRIRKAINPTIVARRENLKSWVYATLVMLICAGVLGALRLGPASYPNLPAFVCLFFAGFSLSFFAIRVRLTAKKISKSLSQRLASERFTFIQALEQDYKEGIWSFYSAYGNLLGSVRQSIYKAQQEHQPNLEQRNRLFLELMILEQGF